jgi:hypothetical protein
MKKTILITLAVMTLFVLMSCKEADGGNGGGIPGGGVPGKGGEEGEQGQIATQSEKPTWVSFSTTLGLNSTALLRWQSTATDEYYTFYIGLNDGTKRFMSSTEIKDAGNQGGSNMPSNNPAIKIVSPPTKKIDFKPSGNIDYTNISIFGMSRRQTGKTESEIAWSDPLSERQITYINNPEVTWP